MISFEALDQWPSQLSIETSQVHLYRFSLDAPSHLLPKLRTELNSKEIARADRLIDPLLGQQYVAGRSALRRLLSAYISVSPAEIQFKYGEHGKPYLANSMDSTLQFNLSHTKSTALLAIGCDGELGVDIEHVQSRSAAEKIASRFFSDIEVSDFLAQAEDQRQAAFFRCWTRKEAYLKAMGAGLSFPLKEFVVSLAEEQEAKLLQHFQNPLEVDRWAVTDLYDPNYIDYQAALFSEGKPISLQAYELNW